MGFSLKKAVKSVTKSPLKAAVRSSAAMMTGGLSETKPGQKIMDTLLNGKPGPANPYSPAEPSTLYDTSKLDFLKDPTKTGLDMSKFGFLRSPSKTFANSYQTPTYGRSDAMFNDLLGTINAPSSVDEAQKGIDTETMNNLLAGADRDTAQSVGSTKMDFLDRGLSGPGMMSDIEGNALATARAQGDQAKTAARLNFANSELAREKAREDAARTALTTRYQTGASQDAADAAARAQGTLADVNSQNQRDLSYADLLKTSGEDSLDASKLYAQLLNPRDIAAYTGQNQAYQAGAELQQKYKRPSFFDQLLGSFAPEAGKALATSLI